MQKPFCCTDRKKTLLQKEFRYSKQPYPIGWGLLHSNGVCQLYRECMKFCLWEKLYTEMKPLFRYCMKKAGSRLRCQESGYMRMAKWMTEALSFSSKSTRGGEHSAAFLKGFTGYLICDVYDANNVVANVIRCGCWTHTRRYFVETLPKVIRM